MKGSLAIQLFDEFVDDILEDDRNHLTDVYHRISSRFMAELRIPLNDLYFGQRVTKWPQLLYSEVSIQHFFSDRGNI